MAEPTTLPLQIPEAAVMAAPSASPSSPHSPLRSQTNRPQLPRRQSRFTEDMTGEHTPAPSVYETPSLADRETAPSFVSVPATTTSRPSQGRPRGAASTYFDT